MSIISKIRRFTYAKLCAKVHKWLLGLLGIWGYPAYWRYKIKGRVENPDFSHIYFTARPNIGAGIGHQITNWISGYCWAKHFRLPFAHLPFSSKSWDDFLGFGRDEVQVTTLIKNGWTVRRIPLFDEDDAKSVELAKNIISTYSGKKTIILCEQDQSYRYLYDVMDVLKVKFRSAHANDHDMLTYEPSHFNVAIHVRRGDIMADPANENLAMRFLSNDYYEKVLQQVVNRFTQLQDKPVHIYFFSQGKVSDYPEFLHYDNIHWCLDMDAQNSFLHMVHADLLITSRSSFSYKPALMNNGIKVCPREFWHPYPDTDDWNLCENNGEIYWKVNKQL